MIFQTRICCACCSTSREVTFQLCRLKYSYGKLNIFASLYRHSPVIDPGLFDVFGNFGTVTRIYKFCGFWAKLTTGPAKEGLWDWRGSCSVRGCLVKGTAAWFETSAPSSTRQLWLQLCADDGRNNCTVWICLDWNCKVTRSRGHNRMKTVFHLEVEICWDVVKNVRKWLKDVWLGTLWLWRFLLSPLAVSWVYFCRQSEGLPEKWGVKHSFGRICPTPQWVGVCVYMPIHDYSTAAIAQGGKGGNPALHI